MFFRILAAMAAVFFLGSTARAQPVETGHLTAELVAASDGIQPGGTIHLALRQKIQPHWHTYWRNAGDSGEATKAVFTLPPGWRAGEFIWPTPKRLPVGPLVNYGYEGEVLLPVALTAPAGARPGETVTIRAAAAFLVCNEICVPEDAVLTLKLPVTANPRSHPKWGPRIAATVSAAPRPAGLTARFEPGASGVKLAIVGAPLKGADVAGAYFFPFASTVIDHAKPQVVEQGPEGLTLTLPSGYDFQGANPPKALAGVLALPGAAFEVSATAGPPLIGARGLGHPASHAHGGDSGLGLGPAAAFAFIGGLILNLMPCVFPVLALKAASLAGHGGSARAEVRRQGLAFGLGAMATFLILAGLLIALREAGSQLGWGFQLQSPAVVLGLALLMLAIGLNLSGVYELGGGLQGAGSSLADRGGLNGAFFTGALAVVVAAPCTAPFMGAAVGWALVQPAVTALVVFAALGAGFAAPFVAVTFAPGLLERLPKPGAWMATFKEFLAFPMYATAGWLIWVLAQQVDAEGLARGLTAVVMLAMAAWVGGRAQRGMMAGGRTILGVAAAVALLAGAAFVGVAAPYQTPGAPPPSTSAHVPSEPYTPERLAELRAQGRAVFVNYTAAWCVSCQVNDRIAISTHAVAAAMRNGDIAYLKADWTRRDPIIAAELARFGRAGVPLYLVYGPDGGEPTVLPALLTESLVIKALESAAKGA